MCFEVLEDVVLDGGLLVSLGKSFSFYFVFFLYYVLFSCRLFCFFDRSGFIYFDFSDRIWYRARIDGGL